MDLRKINTKKIEVGRLAGSDLDVGCLSKSCSTGDGTLFFVSKANEIIRASLWSNQPQLPLPSLCPIIDINRIMPPKPVPQQGLMRGLTDNLFGEKQAFTTFCMYPVRYRLMNLSRKSKKNRPRG